MSYEPLTTMDGVAQVHDTFAGLCKTAVEDGLDVMHFTTEGYGDIELPDRLHAFLDDLRLLRRVPLCYLVPDASLLAPESIRFFHIDRTWVDRLIDGVLSVGATGTIDYAYSYAVLQGVRDRLDADLQDAARKAVDDDWPGDGAMTGMLVRSELARRWPDMIVDAWTKGLAGGARSVAVLRSEPISRDVHISIFAGSPDVVRIREPFQGTRYGVEPTVDATKWEVDRRKPDGMAYEPGQRVAVKARAGAVGAADRVLDIGDLGKVGTARMVALHLEQRPYAQQFDNAVEEPRGSVTPDSVEGGELRLRHGSMMMSAFVQQAALQAKAGLP